MKKVKYQKEYIMKKIINRTQSLVKHCIIPYEYYHHIINNKIKLLDYL